MSKGASSFHIGKREIGDGKPCLVIAEVGQAHDGSLGLAHSFIDAAADAGADAIKFQTHIAAAESTREEPFRVHFSKQDKSRYEYWKRMEFSVDQWKGLADHARERGMLFLSSPFSLEAVGLLIEVGVPAWKIASGEASNSPMLDRIAQTRLPMLISTGMSSIAEIDDIVSRIRSSDLPFALMQCTSAYPCPPGKVGLNMIPFFRQRHHCPVGLSDHSGTIFPGLAAAVVGASLVEVHIVLSREMFGPDVPASVTTAELKQLVEGIRFVEGMLADPVDKDRIANELEPLRLLFSKSVVPKADLPAGTVVEARHLTAKKPGYGIPPERMNQLVGLRLARAVKKDQILSEEDLVETESAKLESKD